jgi:hypothetical protein
MQTVEYALLTCLAVFKSQQWPYVGGLAHHCRRELPHTVHKCACGIEWHDG